MKYFILIVLVLFCIQVNLLDAKYRHKKSKNSHHVKSKRIHKKKIDFLKSIKKATNVSKLVEKVADVVEDVADKVGDTAEDLGLDGVKKVADKIEDAADKVGDTAEVVTDVLEGITTLAAQLEYMPYGPWNPEPLPTGETGNEVMNQEDVTVQFLSKEDNKRYMKVPMKTKITVYEQQIKLESKSEFKELLYVIQTRRLRPLKTGASNTPEEFNSYFTQTENPKDRHYITNKDQLDKILGEQKEQNCFILIEYHNMARYELTRAERSEFVICQKDSQKKEALVQAIEKQFLEEMKKSSYNDLNFIDIGKSFSYYYHGGDVLLSQMQGRLLEDSLALFQSLKVVGSLKTGFRYTQVLNCTVKYGETITLSPEEAEEVKLVPPGKFCIEWEVEWVEGDDDPTLMNLCTTETNDAVALWNIKTTQKTINGACALSNIEQPDCNKPGMKENKLCQNHVDCKLLENQDKKECLPDCNKEENKENPLCKVDCEKEENKDKPECKVDCQKEENKDKPECKVDCEKEENKDKPECKVDCNKEENKDKPECQAKVDCNDENNKDKPECSCDKKENKNLPYCKKETDCNLPENKDKPVCNTPKPSCETNPDLCPVDCNKPENKELEECKNQIDCKKEENKDKPECKVDCNKEENKEKPECKVDCNKEENKEKPECKVDCNKEENKNKPECKVDCKKEENKDKPECKKDNVDCNLEQNKELPECKVDCNKQENKSRPECKLDCNLEENKNKDECINCENPEYFDNPKCVDCEKPQYANHEKCKKKKDCELDENKNSEECQKVDCDLEENKNKAECQWEKPNVPDTNTTDTNSTDNKNRTTHMVVEADTIKTKEAPDFEGTYSLVKGHENNRVAMDQTNENYSCDEHFRKIYLSGRGRKPQNRTDVKPPQTEEQKPLESEEQKPKLRLGKSMIKQKLKKHQSREEMLSELAKKIYTVKEIKKDAPVHRMMKKSQQFSITSPMVTPKIMKNKHHRRH